MVKALINAGAQLNVQNQDLDTPLHLAIRANRADIVHILLEHGANPGIEGYSHKDAVQTAYECNLLDLAEELEQVKLSSTLDFNANLIGMNV